MDILARKVTYKSDEQDGGIHDYPIQEYPLPHGCSRFILPVEVRQRLHGHPLGSDLYTRAAGHYLRDPKHDSFLQQCHVVYYCIRGTLRVRTAAADRLLSPGDIVISPPGISALGATSEDKQLEFYWVAFSGGLSVTYTQFINISDDIVSVGVNAALVAQFEALCRLHDLHMAGTTLERFINGANLLKLLLTSIPVLVSDKANAKKGRIDLEQVYDLMVQRLSGSLRLDEIARASNLSRFHFARSFKRQTGATPMQYFTLMRLQHACRLLDTTARTIKQISANVGYSDPQYFSRSFRQVFGVAPQAYRNRVTRVEAAVTNALPELPGRGMKR